MVDVKKGAIYLVVFVVLITITFISVHHHLSKAANDGRNISTFGEYSVQTTDSQSERDVLIATISAGSAIGGALLGSLFTYKYGTKIENEKQKREKEKEEDFHRRIEALVKHELNAYSEFLDNIDKKSTEVPVGTNPRRDDRRINAEEAKCLPPNILDKSQNVRPE